jgi:hypothetical protein
VQRTSSPTAHVQVTAKGNSFADQPSVLPERGIITEKLLCPDCLGPEEHAVHDAWAAEQGEGTA